MAVKEDVSRVRVVIDGKQALNQLGLLEMKAKELAVDMNQAKKGTEKYVDASKRLEESKQQISKLRQELGLSGMTMSQLGRYQTQLKKEIATTTTFGTARYKSMRAELMRVNNTLATQRAHLAGTSGFFSKLGAEIKQFGVAQLSLLAGAAGLAALAGLVSGAGKLSDSLADVAKTTNLTDSEIKELNKTFKEMETRTARKELRELAVVAGRLGIKGVQDIAGFVSAADKLNVALGDVLGDPEEVMKALGKVAGVFGITEMHGVEKGFLKLGSAINELGMSSTANEQYLVSFTKRMSGIAPLAKITAPNILGLGATLDHLGQTSEVSSTALSKLFVKMAKDSESFAKQAKMPVQDFIKLLNKDANEAFIAVLEGVKGNSDGMTQLAATLGDVGADGGRVVGVLGSLANNTKLLREQQEISNRAFNEGTSVLKEFNIKNNNLAANLEKIGKWFHALFINQTVMDGINKVASKMADWVTGTAVATRNFEQINDSVYRFAPRIDDLARRYDDLGKFAIRNTEQQAEMEKIFKELSTTIPTAVTQFDEYGNAVSISTDRVRDFTKAQIEARKILNEEAIAEQSAKLQEVNRQLDLTARKLNNRDEEGHLFKNVVSQSGLASKQIRLTAQEINSLTKGITELTGKKTGLEEILRTLGMQDMDKKEGYEKSLAMNAAYLQARIKEEKDAKADLEKLDEEEATRKAEFDKAAWNKKQKDLEENLKSWESYQAKILKMQREGELNLLEDEEKAKEKVNDRYKVLETELKTHLENKMIDLATFELESQNLTVLKLAELAEINQKFRDSEQAKEDKFQQEKANAADTLSELGLDPKEKARKDIEDHYSKLLDLARKFSLDESIVTDERLKALAALEQKHREEDIKSASTTYEMKTKMIADFAETAVNMLDIVNAFSKDSATFDKAIALTKALIATGEAIANMIPLFASTSITPFDLAAKIAAGTTIIATNIKTAIKAISKANPPEKPEKPETTAKAAHVRRTSVPRRSFFEGGFTGDGMGIGDKDGEFAGFVHKKEYVIPQKVMSEPFVASLLPAIEAIRKHKIRGFAEGGMTSASPSFKKGEEFSLRQVENLLTEISNQIKKMPKEIKAYTVYQDHEKIRLEAETLQNRYKA